MFFNIIFTIIFIFCLTILSIISNNVRSETINFKFVIETVFRVVLTGLVGYWITQLYKFGEKIKNPRRRAAGN